MAHLYVHRINRPDQTAGIADSKRVPGRANEGVANLVLPSSLSAKARRGLIIRNFVIRSSLKARLSDIEDARIDATLGRNSTRSVFGVHLLERAEAVIGE